MNEVKQPIRKKTWFDRAGEIADSVVSVFAPVAGENRRRYRNRIARMRSASEDKDRSPSDNTRGGSWIGSRLSADGEAEQDLDSQRAKARELYKRHSIGGAVDSRVNLVVSNGFTPQARIKERKGLCTADQATLWNQQLEDVYTQTAPRISQCGTRSVWQLSRLAERHHGVEGESITILSDRGDADKPIPLTLEVVDPERMQTPPELIGNPLVRLGIEYDKSGRIVAYHIRNSHPGDATGDPRFTKYPADRIIHVFEPLAAGQSRGLPWLVRNLDRIKDSEDLDEAAIIGAQAEACVAGIVKKSSVSGDEHARNSATGTSADGHRLKEFRPGGFHYLDYDEEFEFTNPVKGNGYGPIQEWNHRRMAVGANYPYEMLTKNWTGLSFAAGRLSLAEARLFAKSQQHLLREMWFCRIWERIVFESVAVGAVDISPYLYNKARWWFHRHEWTAPAWPFALTPLEEIKAAILAVDENIRTKASVVAEFTGGDLEDVFDQREIERKQERTRRIDPASSEVPQEEPTYPQQRELERQAA